MDEKEGAKVVLERARGVEEVESLTSNRGQHSKESESERPIRWKR